MAKDFVPLRLLARDEEDLTVVAAHLQDALLPLMSMVFEPNDGTFTILANRFCWEHPVIDHEGEPMYHRVHSGICFRNVEGIHYQGFDRKKSPEILSLLTVMSNENEAIHLVCSQAHHIRIKTKDLHCHLGDIHHPWPTRKKPTHLYEHIEELQKGEI